ncbi:hypothetical protein AGOR_G00050250 [Albula goreensis]|uniref:Thyroxine-binding globulin n=1 Tax=Albula goreensis TaxID=1534307 RepID=A0A8T3E0R8_9TELE|nr:hypothetical protein AGOR_G00050250 [Albula goreensis]
MYISSVSHAKGNGVITCHWRVTKMRVFLSLCVVLVVLWSTVRSQEHSHSHHNHHDERVNGSLIFEENTDFAFRLYKHISALPGSQSQNVFFSPLSISVALSALSMGARGKTHQQLFEGLGFNATDITAEEVSQSFQSILENLNNKTDVNLSLGSTLFVGETFKPLHKFLESMKRYYHADGFSTDFTKTEEAKEQINKYVEEKTKGKITKLVENLDPQTLMYLISYIYFKGKWEVPFIPKSTKEQPFYINETTTVPVQMMFVEDFFNIYYDTGISADILQLKYSGSVSMLLVLPGKGLQGVEEVVSRVHVAKWLRWMKRIKAKVFIPKFSIKTSYKLNDVLSGMGITDIFEDTAEFSGITDEQKVKVSEVVHQASLDVDESGATAAAATGVGLMPLSFVRYPVLRFDRPFMVIMCEQETKSVLFLGKIVNPSKK